MFYLIKILDLAFFKKAPLYTVRADILGYFPDNLGQRPFQATWHCIFLMALHIRIIIKQKCWVFIGAINRNYNILVITKPNSLNPNRSLRVQDL